MTAAALTALLLAWAAPAGGTESPIDVGGRIRASAEAAQGLQGPLDGSWILHDASGEARFAFQIVDPPGGAAPLQGAWRDLTGQAEAGVIADPRRNGDILVLRLRRREGEPPVALRLRADGHGGWRGRMILGGAAQAVVLRRDQGAPPAPPAPPP